MLEVINDVGSKSTGFDSFAVLKVNISDEVVWPLSEVAETLK